MLTIEKNKPQKKDLTNNFAGKNRDKHAAAGVLEKIFKKGIDFMEKPSYNW